MEDPSKGRGDKLPVREIDGNEGIYKHVFAFDSRLLSFRAANQIAVPSITLVGMTLLGYAGASHWILAAVGATGLVFFGLALLASKVK